MSSDTDVKSKKRVKMHFGISSLKKPNQSSSPTSRDSSELGTEPSADRKQPPPPLPSISIGSKLAATYSRLPKPANYTQTESAVVARPSTISPSTSRTASYESGSSNISRPRSTTPRPAPKPLITVSLSPDNVVQKPFYTASTALGPSTHPSSPTPNSRFQAPIHPHRRGQTPASAIAAAHRQATTDDRSRGLEQDVNLRLRIKSSNTHVRNRPPSIPLPQTPVPNAAPSRSDSFYAELEAIGAQKAIARPRALKIGSVVSSSPAAQLPSKTRAPNFDIETASAPQLRGALKTRNRQYDDLVKEVEGMKKKILSLDKELVKKEKEASRKDKELKGLRWIINEGHLSQPQPLPAGVSLNHALLSPTSTLSESDQDSSRMVPGGSSRLVYYQSDSGTESHAESMSILSAASGSKSLSLRKPSAPAYHFYPNVSTRLPSKMRPGLGAEKTIPENHQYSVSASSSTSSLLPPSPSVTMSSLSAIPEAEGPEKRRVLGLFHRVSASSMTSSTGASSSASSAGNNIKRSRPPSIAQVLEKSPIMDDVLENLRPFA